jgi:hypothetical protein
VERALHQEPQEQVTAPLRSSQRQVFQVFYIVDDEGQSVEVVETNRIDLEELRPHLMLGGSIYITPKKRQRKSQVSALAPK